VAPDGREHPCIHDPPPNEEGVDVVSDVAREIRRPPRRRLMQIRRRFSGRAIVLWAAFYGVFVGNVLATA
jgi:hypothetical protein